MQRIAKFEKVSESRFGVDAIKTRFAMENLADNASVATAYASLSTPSRATVGSAGYDFCAPFDFTLKPGESVTVPTGIRVKIAEGWVLQIFPKSGLGFKYRLQLDNTVGIIDSDYYYSDNEGHILVRVSNLSLDGKILAVKAGQGFCQGIFLPFGITEDDTSEGRRNGGFGSTERQS